MSSAPREMGWPKDKCVWAYEDKFLELLLPTRTVEFDDPAEVIRAHSGAEEDLAGPRAVERQPIWPAPPNLKTPEQTLPL